MTNDVILRFIIAGSPCRATKQLTVHQTLRPSVTIWTLGLRLSDQHIEKVEQCKQPVRLIKTRLFKMAATMQDTRVCLIIS